ncbi:bifunctional phosphopantothenoylcysteine decarboxylase/phosphopantothenate--cysteine ligase CoaBC [candidate division KSB1 bacterium]|nr:bifunctional phosphopantothenoylcysteine decarboxylase/phosphopantothenate--cysteine ligase CoaBC [candidate division KSB1 bacterium]
MFTNKRILVGVTGGIAAYKTCELVRKLVKLEAHVKVVMTEAAKQFITPLSFETLSANPVSWDQFENSTIHIDLVRNADCIVICPATANTIGKIANGIADNLLTTLISAATIPVILCPAMNKEMYRHPIFQSNVEKLKQHEYHFIDPAEGELACGEYGWGRLAELEDILFGIRRVLFGSDALKDKKVIVTAGPTEEPIDPVRVISNHSSGKMGYALAEAAALHGARVTLVSGPTALSTINEINLKTVRTAQQMKDTVFSELPDSNMLIMAAAVSDFAPKRISEHKIKKEKATFQLELQTTPDILAETGKMNSDIFRIGFALETNNEISNALQKLENKKLDFIVLNNPMEPGANFGSNANRVTIIESKEKIEKLPLLGKDKVAERIIQKAIERMKSNE